jgi:hypothetical protein
MIADGCPAELTRSETNTTKIIDIADIVVPAKRLRALQPDKVNALAESMQAPQGLLQAIGVRPYPAPPYCIIFGVHRLEAAKMLGWATIAATVLNGIDADQAELVEIDENLCRAELGPAEEAAHLAARKAIYLRLYPETRRGGDRSKSQDETLVPAFLDDTATKTGKGRATVARKTARGERINDVKSLAGTSLDTGIELDALSKLSKSEQYELIARAKAGEQISAAAVIAEQQLRNVERNADFAAEAPLTVSPLPTDPYSRESLQALSATERAQIATNLFAACTNDEIRAVLPAKVIADLMQHAADRAKDLVNEREAALLKFKARVATAVATQEHAEHQIDRIKGLIEKFERPSKPIKIAPSSLH